MVDLEDHSAAADIAENHNDQEMKEVGEQPTKPTDCDKPSEVDNNETAVNGDNKPISDNTDKSIETETESRDNENEEAVVDPSSDFELSEADNIATDCDAVVNDNDSTLEHDSENVNCVNGTEQSEPITNGDHDTSDSIEDKVPSLTENDGNDTDDVPVCSDVADEVSEVTLANDISSPEKDKEDVTTANSNNEESKENNKDNSVEEESEVDNDRVEEDGIVSEAIEKESEEAKSKDSGKVQVLMSMFVDQSKEESDEKGATKDSDNKEIVKEDNKKESTISLEPADPEDNSTESDDDMDVNAGLDKCFDALEKKIANEDKSDSNSVKDAESTTPAEKSQPATKDKTDASTVESNSGSNTKTSEEVQVTSEDSSEVEM